MHDENLTTDQVGTPSSQVSGENRAKKPAEQSAGGSYDPMRGPKDMETALGDPAD